MTSEAPMFAVNEKVLCYHGPLLYEAKIIQVGTDDEKKYKVHYKGWKQTWDEWVPADNRVLKWNDNNLEEQKMLQQRAGQAAGKAQVKGARWGFVVGWRA